MIKDRNIAWKAKRVFIPAIQFAGLLEDGTSKVLTSLGAGTPVMQEVLAAAQLAGIAINAAGNEVFHFWPIPRDMDRAMPLRARIHFFHASTDGDNPVWKVFYKGIGKTDTLTAANSTPDETLTLPAHVVSVNANSLEITNWIKSVSETKIAATDIALLLTVECDGLGSASANEITFMGLELEYTLEACAEQRQDTKYLPLGGV